MLPVPFVSQWQLERLARSDADRLLGYLVRSPRRMNCTVVSNRFFLVATARDLSE